MVARPSSQAVTPVTPRGSMPAAGRIVFAGTTGLCLPAAQAGPSATNRAPCRAAG